MSKLSDFSHLLVKPGKAVHLARLSTDSTRHVPSRDKAELRTQLAAARIGELQDALYSEGKQALLVILQGMDASGKDGTVRTVFGAVNPTGIQVTSFKQPSAEELRHDFLWRCHARVPPLGHVGVFNRSYYEDVLIVRVHAERLLPPEQRQKHVWEHRYRMINDFERSLSETGTRVVKFFLHISREEQRERFIARQKDPAKHWKLAAGDFEERKFWDDYQGAYEKALAGTATEGSPWYAIPADHKWVRNYYIAHIVCGILEKMDPAPPQVADPSLVTHRFK
jgi:PPK2 family polyphosphate:nucleotide phosphotransferase